MKIITTGSHLTKRSILRLTMVQNGKNEKILENCYRKIKKFLKLKKKNSLNLKKKEFLMSSALSLAIKKYEKVF